MLGAVLLKRSFGFKQIDKYLESFVTDANVVYKMLRFFVRQDFLR